MLGGRLGPGTHPRATAALSPSAALPAESGEGAWDGLVHCWAETAQKSRTRKRPEVCINILSAWHQLKILADWEETPSSRELFGICQNSTSKYIVPCMPLVKWLRWLNLYFNSFLCIGVLWPELFLPWSPCHLGCVAGVAHVSLGSPGKPAAPLCE